MTWLYDCVTAGAIGFFAWQGVPWLIPLSTLMPVLAFVQRSRLRAFAVAFSYYAVASWPLIPAALGFFEPPPSLGATVLYWLTPSVLQAIPWVLCWTALRRQVWYRMPLAFVLTVVPPLGIIGWASPLTSAGILFPGWSWFGLTALIALAALACVRRLEAAAIALVCAFIANAVYTSDPKPPESWEGVRTEFGRMTDPTDPLPEFRAAEGVQRIALSSTNRTLVFSEFVVARWTESTEAFWQPTIDQARANGTTLLIGAGLPIAASDGIRNAVIVTGNTAAQPFVQRVPIPIIMWNPLKPRASIPLDLLGPGILELNGERAAILVCYEQLLTWPILRSALEHPTLIVGISNDHWVKDTHIPAAKEAPTTAWARLFALPKIIATNK